MSTRALKRRRLDSDGVGSQSSTLTPRQTRTSESKTKDDEADEITVSSPFEVRSTLALQKNPTPSHERTTGLKAPNATQNVVSSPAPRSSTSAWREAKQKSMGYRRRMGKTAQATTLPTASTETSKPDVFDDIEGAHIAVKPRDQPTKDVGRTTAQKSKATNGGRGVRAKTRAPNKEVHEADEVVVKQKNPSKEAQKHAEEDDEDELVGVHDDVVSSPKKSEPSKRNKSLTNNRMISPSLTKSTTKPLDRRKAKQILAEEDEVALQSNEEFGDEVEDKAEDIEMMDAPAIVTTPRKAKDYGQKANNVVNADITITAATPEGLKLPTTDISSSSFTEPQLKYIQQVVLEKATGKRSIELVNLDVEYAKVHAVVDQTVTAGESNSMLVIGARGCGKSALVNRIIREQMKQHPGDFHTVRLNGFIHTDDKIALREIWRQLGREMDLDDEATSKNYADTLTTLLALLSHPSEVGTDQHDQITKSVIFIIDEFELFANHPRQTLLYNLFDIAQSRKAPIVVLGLTTRIDVAESLEKRVKSRFSHRYVHLSLAKSFQAFEDTCKAAMTIADIDLKEEEKSELGVSTGIRGKLQTASSTSDGEQPTSVEQWNQLIDHIFVADAVQSFLRSLYYTTKSVPQFITSLLYSTATIPIEPSTSAPDLLSHFETTLTSQLQSPDSKLTLLPSLSTLQLGLLVCAARLTAIHDAETVSFALAYDEYKTLASKVKLQASASGAIAQGAGGRVWGRDVARNAWEALTELGFILEDGRAGGGGGGGGGGAGRVDVGLEEIGMSGVDLGFWARWCREI